MRIKTAYEGKSSVGFIEYIPGEYAWRAVNATGFMLIHCLWVVGRGKDKGYGSRLLKACIDDARRSRMRGVAMVTSSGNWLAGNRILLRNGFESVDDAPPSFELLVKSFGKARSPAFPGDWDARLRRRRSGLTIFRTSQCPYLDNAVNIALEVGRERDLKTRVVELKNAQDVREHAPSPYGVFSLVYKGKLLSHYYTTKSDLEKLLDETPERTP